MSFSFIFYFAKNANNSKIDVSMQQSTDNVDTKTT